MAGDEVVNGAQIVAKILKALDPGAQERLMASISAKRPDVAAKVETEMFNFDRIAQLNDTTVQELIRQVPYRDIVVALKTAPEQVKDRIMSNMSEAKKRIVSEDVRDLPKSMKSTDIQAAQKRILRKLEAMYPDDTDSQETKTIELLRSSSKIRSA